MRDESARLRARLHLAGRDAPFDVEVRPGDAALVEERDVVAALVRRRDARDRIHLGDDRLDRRSPAGRVRAGLASVLEATVAADVPVRDHLAVVVGRRRADALLGESPLLADRGDDPAGVLSGGERRVLAWLRVRAVDPRAVVLDGAGAGLDDEALAWAGRQVQQWRDDGVPLVVRPARAEERQWCAS